MHKVSPPTNVNKLGGAARVIAEAKEQMDDLRGNFEKVIYEDNIVVSSLKSTWFSEESAPEKRVTGILVKDFQLLENYYSKISKHVKEIIARLELIKVEYDEVLVNCDTKRLLYHLDEQGPASGQGQALNKIEEAMVAYKCGLETLAKFIHNPLKICQLHEKRKIDLDPGRHGLKSNILNEIEASEVVEPLNCLANLFVHLDYRVWGFQEEFFSDFPVCRVIDSKELFKNRRGNWEKWKKSCGRVELIDPSGFNECVNVARKVMEVIAAIYMERSSEMSYKALDDTISQPGLIIETASAVKGGVEEEGIELQ